MILAKVNFNDEVAVLTERGWHVDGSPIMSDILNLDAPLSHFGPADGDPVKCAANRVAEFTKGYVSFVRESTATPDTVF